MPEMEENTEQFVPEEKSDSSYPQATKADDSSLSPPVSHPEMAKHNEQKQRRNDSQSMSSPVFMQDKGVSPIPSIIVWVTFALALFLTIFYWMSDYSNVKSIAEKESEKNSIVSQLNSENNRDAEDQANGFKLAFSRLSALVKQDSSKIDFLNELYSHLTRDVKISTLSLSAENELGMDCLTGSYRQVADFVLALEGFSKLSNISLNNVSKTTESGVSFSVSAKANTAPVAETTAETPADTAPADTLDTAADVPVDSAATVETTPTAGQ